MRAHASSVHHATVCCSEAGGGGVELYPVQQIYSFRIVYFTGVGYRQEKRPTYST